MSKSEVAGAAIGIAGIAAAIGIGVWQMSTPVTVNGMDDLLATAMSIESFMRDHPDAISSASSEELQLLAERLAPLGAQLGLALAVIPEGRLFDLELQHALDLPLPSGATIPLSVKQVANVYSMSKVMLNGQEHDMVVGEFLEVEDGGETCRLLLVSQPDAGTSRFRWRCSGF
ncbi:hypothetical protein [Poseidonocella sp. HB161398]|uniref:hypothetical protein n=1 Tax=Poseidonocella sp. HB161398 TaxID=2320855 RepID=UPI00110984E8|nr:hypothetical protein [Poseidonocella sp. HB161398]